MSKENVEIVRRVFDAEARRDSEALNTLVDLDVEVLRSDSPFGDFAESTPLHGREQLQAAHREFYSAFNDVEAEVGELIEAGNNVIAVFSYRGTGRSSGLGVEFRDMAGVYTVRNGKVVRIVWVRSREQALEAAGLSE
jgi:ketosteroid isomerase-like protein